MKMATKYFGATLTAALLILSTFIATAADKRNQGEAAKLPKVTNVRIDGYVGQRIDDCINNRVVTQDVDHLVSPFRRQDETEDRWQTEFWGKWVQGAMSSYEYTHDKALYELIKQSVDLMLETQLPSGYIGNYDTDRQLTGWDVWGRKYVTLGLVKWYNLSGEKRALKAAKRLIDYTIEQIGPGKTPVYETGNYRGMASGSILEPVVMLYNATGEQRYLDFAKHLATSLDEAEDGPQLLRRADLPVAERFPVPDLRYWTRQNSAKAYEMMSCYVGYLELYKVTGDERYLQAVETVARHIMDEEINIVGGSAASESWFHGRDRQTTSFYNAMETCVTFTWMQLNERLLQITGNPIYADNIEVAALNALMASMRSDGSDIVKYIPLDGFRHGAGGQCGMELHCCNANGPRGFAMIPRISYMIDGEGALLVNMYGPSAATVAVGDEVLDFEIESAYPRSGKVRFHVKSGSKAQLPIKFRIPAWSTGAAININGMGLEDLYPGKYFTLNRKWNTGDVVELDLDMNPRLTVLNHHQAIMQGPVVLARDSRFDDGCIDEVCVISEVTMGGSNEKRVVLTEDEVPEGMWLCYKLTAPIGTYPWGDATNIEMHFCDFASAGNLWSDKMRYRVWLPMPVNARRYPLRD